VKDHWLIAQPACSAIYGPVSRAHNSNGVLEDFEKVLLHNMVVINRTGGFRLAARKENRNESNKVWPKRRVHHF
jgi:hypothetical protein